MRLALVQTGGGFIGFPVAPGFFFNFNGAEVGAHHNAVGIVAAVHRKGGGGGGGIRKRGKARNQLPAGKLKALAGQSAQRYAQCGLGAGVRGRNRAALTGHNADLHPCAAHGNGVVFHKAGLHALGGGDFFQRLGAGILIFIGVGAYVSKQCVHAVFGKMHPVAQGVVFFGPAGGFVFQGLGTVEVFIPLGGTHFANGLVVSIHLRLAQAAVFALGIQRGNAVYDQRRIGIGLVNGLEALFVGVDELFGVGAGAAQVVGAKGDDDALRLQDLDGLGHGHGAAHAGKLLAFQRGDRAHAHAYHANVVADGGVGFAGFFVAVHHKAHGVGIPQKQGVGHILGTGVLGFGQHGALKFFGVDHAQGGIVVKILFGNRRAVRSGGIGRGIPGRAAAGQPGGQQAGAQHERSQTAHTASDLVHG